jgi:phage terminase small subunit
LPRSLTPKQEAFAHKYVETGNASEAYRFAYDAEGMSLPVVWKEASLLLDNPKVSVRVSEIQERSLKRVDVSAEDIVRGLFEIAQDETAPHSARVSAYMGLAKRHPEFSDKHDVKVDQRSQALIAVSEMPLEQLIAIAEGIKDDE